MDNAASNSNTTVPANEELEHETEPLEVVEKPYNVSVPLSRVKRIIKQDDDIVTVAASAVYAIASATELFVKYLSEEAYVNARADQRKRLTYNDFANAVSQQERLEFLSTLVPKATPYKVVKKSRADAAKSDALKNQTFFSTDNNNAATLVRPSTESASAEVPQSLAPITATLNAPASSIVQSSTPVPSANPLSNILSTTDETNGDTTMSEET